MSGAIKKAAYAIAVILTATSALAGNFDVLRAIDTKEASGEISRGTAALYRIYAHQAPERLPGWLTSQIAKMNTGTEFERCGTMDLMAARRALPLMALSERTEAEALFADEGATAPRISAMVAGKTVTHSLTYWVETANFSIEWGQDLTNEDGTTPVKDDNENGVPDAIELWASYFEDSFAKIRALGFTDTPDLNTYKIKVLIANTDPNSTLDNMSTGYYGETRGNSPHPPGNPPARIIVNGDLGEIVAIAPNDLNSISFLDGVHGAMMVTAAHELHHVIQFMYTPDAWATTGDQYDWFAEGTSTWIEDEAYPFVNDYAQYYDSTYGWQMFPEYTLAAQWSISNTSVRRSRFYGSAIFQHFLTQHVGGKETVSNVWANLKNDLSFDNSVAGAANTAAGLSGVWTMEDVFLGFAGANANMDYDDGVLYGTSPRRNSPAPAKWGSALKDASVVSGGGANFSITGATSLAMVTATNTTTDKYALVIPKSSTSLSINANTGETLTGITAGPSSSYTSTFATAVVYDATPPAQVTGLSVAATNSGFTAEWDALTGDESFAGYVVEWRKTGQTKWYGRAIAGKMTSAIVRDHTILPSTQYDVRVFAYDSASNRGTPSAESQVTTLDKLWYPAAASLVAASSINLSPWFDEIEKITVDPGTPVAFTVTAHDPEGAALEYGVINLPSNATFNDVTGAFAWTPSKSQSGERTITFLASDGVNNMQLKVIITVTGTPSSDGGGGGGGGGCLIEVLRTRN